MPDHIVLVIFLFGGEIVWDNGNPIHSGGCPRMAFLKIKTTYSELVQKICDLSNSNKLRHIPIVQYLHHHFVAVVVHIRYQSQQLFAYFGHGRREGAAIDWETIYREAIDVGNIL